MPAVGCSGSSGCASMEAHCLNLDEVFDRGSSIQRLSHLHHIEGKPRSFAKLWPSHSESVSFTPVEVWVEEAEFWSLCVKDEGIQIELVFHVLYVERVPPFHEQPLQQRAVLSPKQQAGCETVYSGT